VTQILANALVSAAGYLLVGIGFSLVYTTGRFFHFAHGIVFTIGAYATFVLRVRAGLPLPGAILGGILTSTLFGVAIEASIYRPLRKRQSTAVTLLLASLGAYVGMQAIVVLLFGSGTQTFRVGSPPEGLSVHYYGTDPGAQSNWQGDSGCG
jgi:branched-chain amino acid transport system permease protein